MTNLRKSFVSAFVVALSVFVLSSCSKSSVAPRLEVVNQEISTDTFRQLQATLCDKQVVLLGEGSFHGEGVTFAFKAKIAQALIEDCGFSLLLFESSFYEFTKINTDISNGRVTSIQDTEAAISPLWKDEVEMQSFIQFLNLAANNQSITLGGIDDRVGSRGQDYSNFLMPIEITEWLDEEMQSECRTAFNQRIMYSFSLVDPYDQTKKQRLLACLNNLEEDDSQPKEEETLSAMRKSVVRMLNRDLTDRKSRFSGRANSMYKNFEYWYDNAQNQPRTIVWSSTVHAAKSGDVLKAFGGSSNFGEYIKLRFSEDAYALGFSALEGAHAKIGGDIENLPTAPENSIEAITMSGTDCDYAFLSAQDLESFDFSPAAAIQNIYETKNWATILDGLVVFREQRPPIRKSNRTNPG